MPRVVVDPAGARLARLLALAVALALMVTVAARWGLGSSRRTIQEPAAAPQAQGGAGTLKAITVAGLMLPTLDLCLPANAQEAQWSDALVRVLGGEREVSVDGGRADVVTEHFAIEVDFLRKWHEGVGQSLHYASATGKRPAIALILPTPAKVLNPASLATLQRIDTIAMEQRIRLLLLSPSSC